MLGLCARRAGLDITTLSCHLHGPVRVAQERCADDRIFGRQGEVGAPDCSDGLPYRLRVRRAVASKLFDSSKLSDSGSQIIGGLVNFKPRAGQDLVPQR